MKIGAVLYHYKERVAGDRLGRAVGGAPTSREALESRWVRLTPLRRRLILIELGRLRACSGAVTRRARAQAAIQASDAAAWHFPF